MNPIGIFICNYNGKEFVLNCVKSLLEQNRDDFDIYVVDNASTDGSVEAIQQEYTNMVEILQNTENRGGAGGFDRGLKYGLKKGYPYIVLLDNDIKLANDAIANMYSFIEEHKDVGIVGAKIMVMDEPDTIQDFGNYLDFQQYREKNAYCGVKETENVPEYNECDYLPSCAIMIRTEMLKKSGTMPADNFIYYDDIELSHKMKRMGSKIVALGNVKVWHKGGFRKGIQNTFSTYYFLRNRLNFFAKFIPKEDVDRYVDYIIREVFAKLYGYHNKGMKEMFQTTTYAFDDFIHRVRGKASQHKIMNIIDRDIPFVNMIKGKEKILIRFMDNVESENELFVYWNLAYILEIIQKERKRETVWISLKESSYSEQEFLCLYNKMLNKHGKKEILPRIEFEDTVSLDVDLILRMCEHVKNVKKNIFPEIYVDRFCNCITCEEDYKNFTGYAVNEKLFLELYRPLVRRTVNEIKEEMDCENKKEVL